LPSIASSNKTPSESKKKQLIIDLTEQSAQQHVEPMQKYLEEQRTKTAVTFREKEDRAYRQARE
jgi:hypothetical protein